MKRAKGSAELALKKRALETLKRKKMYEQQRDSMANQAFNMEQTVFTLETIKNTQTTVATMKQAAEQLKVENKKINIDEITESLGRSYEIPGGCDEEDLEAELALLQDDF